MSAKNRRSLVAIVIVFCRLLDLPMNWSQSLLYSKKYLQRLRPSKAIALPPRALHPQKDACGRPEPRQSDIVVTQTVVPSAKSPIS